jgi:uncharacterized delta-60 repeat protein
MFKLLSSTSLILFLSFSTYAQTGTLDTQFGNAGKAVTDFHSSDIVVASMIQPDNKIVVAGTTNATAPLDSFALVRYQTNGALDPTFGIAGKLTTSFGGETQCFDAVLQPDGKIIAVGSAYSTSTFTTNFALVRYKSNGSFDSSFGANGKAMVAIPQQDGILNCVTLQADNKIVAGASLAGLFTIVRFNTNGKVDSSFGVNGISQLSPFRPHINPPTSILVQPDGKIVAVSGSDSAQKHSFFIARYLSTGHLDSSFGNNGYTSTIMQDATAIFNCYASKVKMQTDGKLVVCGTLTTDIQNTDFGIARYQKNGRIDSSFGVNGKIITDFAGKYDNAYSIAIQSDNKIIVAGDATENIFSDFGIARYLANGNLDAAFGDSGKIVMSMGTYYDYARSVNLQSDGKIVVAGYGDNGDGQGDNFIVVKYNNDNVLPISQLTFGGVVNDNSVSLNWKTCNESNNQGFYIERSANNTKWNSLGYAPAKGNDNGCNNEYSFIDAAPAKGNNLYRLKQIDKDGKYTYSKTLIINFAERISVKISPNPVTDLLYITGLDNANITSISVYSYDGRVVKNISLRADNYILNVKDFIKGVYYLKINEGAISYNYKFIKE